MLALNASNTSSLITVLAANKISPVSLSIKSCEITLSNKYSSGALIDLTPASSSIFVCLAVIRRPFSTMMSLPDLISNSAITPRNLAGNKPTSQDLALSLTLIFSKKVSRIASAPKPIARNNVVTGNLRRRSIRAYKCS